MIETNKIKQHKVSASRKTHLATKTSYWSHLQLDIVAIRIGINIIYHLLSFRFHLHPLNYPLQSAALCCCAKYRTIVDIYKSFGLE